MSDPKHTPASQALADAHAARFKLRLAHYEALAQRSAAEQDLAKRAHAGDDAAYEQWTGAKKAKPPKT